MSQHTKSIMIQGTMSNARKSILAAGLCYIFHQDDYRTAPSKSQSMALNSYMTPEGLEMGRAQTMQTETTRIVPDAGMNPILLKPTTDVEDRVIVYGISRDSMKARDYLACKESLMPDIMTPYWRLEEQYDVIAIEGTGSPTEINLRTDDIVNMGMANMADAPMLLVGDIDKGGVFVQFYGTVALLAEEERKRVRGLIINKFKGNRPMLAPGISMLGDLCGIPVMRVIPYMGVDIEDEDSLSSHLEAGRGRTPVTVDLAVIRFPRISNFTDFNVFSGIPGVSLRYVTRAYDPGTPDMVIPPGTENIIHDLLWMRQSGLEAAILKLADHQVPMWGVYGGYQMMGETLVDEKGVGSDLPSRASGTGLLSLKTEFEKEKIRTQVEGTFGQLDGYFDGLSGKSTEGYEVHMSRMYIDREERATDIARITSWRGEPKICRSMDYVMGTGKDRLLSRKARMDGWNGRNIYGAYVHGIFDSPGVARTVAGVLATTKGLCLEQVADMDYRTYRQQQYDKLVEELRENLDMVTMYRAMGTSQKGKMGVGQEGKGEEKPGDGYTVGTGAAGRH